MAAQRTQTYDHNSMFDNDSEVVVVATSGPGHAIPATDRTAPILHRIAEKFDVKGCLSGRRENADKGAKRRRGNGRARARRRRNDDSDDEDDDDDDVDEAEPVLVLKDANFHDEDVILNFGANRGWFVEQVPLPHFL